MDALTETLSDDPHQKLCAVVALVNSRGDRDDLPPVYRAACRRWYFALTDREKIVAISAAQIFDLGNREKALKIVAALPPAPRLETAIVSSLAGDKDSPGPP
jgi:hypothetical protein